MCGHGKGQIFCFSDFSDPLGLFHKQFIGKGHFGESLSMGIIVVSYLKWKQTVHFDNIKRGEMSVF